MWSKIKDSKAFYIVISIVAAIVCWLYVDIVEAPEMPMTIYNIPVVFAGEDALAEEGLMIVGGNQATVTLTVTGPRSVVSQLNRNNIIITAQAGTQITGEGNYQLDYTVSYPSAISSSSIRTKSRSVEKIDVTVVQMASKTVSVKGEFTGSVEPGYLFDEADFIFNVSEITVSGEKNLVDQVDHAQVILREENLSSTWRGTLDVSLVDADGNPVDAKDLTLDHTTVEATFPVLSVKEIPLTVDIVPGGGAKEGNYSYDIQPQSITVAGTKEALDKVDSIDLGTIDLAQIITSDSLSFDLHLDDGLNNLSGISTATVTVNISGLTVKVVDTEDITLENVPEGIRAQLITTTLTTRIRGSEDLIDLLVDDDVYVTEDLSGVDESGFGTCTVPATVNVRGMSDVGAIGEYKVVVDIQPDR